MKYPITVIITTLDREDITLATLRSFEKQTSLDFELIVLDQTTPASSRLAAYKSPGYHYHYHHHCKKNLPNARNIAAQIAQGEILLFVDDDVIPGTDLVAQFLREFDQNDDSIWVIGGRIYESNSNILCENQNIAGGYLTWYGKTLKNLSAKKYAVCQWVGGGNFAVRREKFSAVGGFDANFIGNAILEDGDFGFRIRASGGHVLFSPLPTLEHLRATSGGTRGFDRDFSMYYRSHNTVYFFRKHKRIVYLPVVFLYLNAVWLNDLIHKRHSYKAYFFMLMGFVKGFFTKVPAPRSLPLLAKERSPVLT